MILANVRGRLRPRDFRLVVLALARGDATRRAGYERVLAEEGPDPLLDEPALFDALLAVRSLVVPSAPLFAHAAVRHALRAAGVDDRDLADYLAALVLEFRSRPARPYPRPRRSNLPLSRGHRQRPPSYYSPAWATTASVAFNRLSDRVLFPYVYAADKAMQKL